MFVASFCFAGGNPSWAAMLLLWRACCVLDIVGPFILVMTSWKNEKAEFLWGMHMPTACPRQFQGARLFESFSCFVCATRCLFKHIVVQMSIGKGPRSRTRCHLGEGTGMPHGHTTRMRLSHLMAVLRVQNVGMGVKHSYSVLFTSTFVCDPI